MVHDKCIIMLTLYRKSLPYCAQYLFNKTNIPLVIPLCASYSQQQKHPQNHNHQQIPPQINHNQQSFKRMGFLLAAASIGGIFGYYVFGQPIDQNTAKHDNQQSNELLNPSKLGGKWQLLNTQQRIFSSDELAGSFYLIYFGYALCPDICPTTLNYLANVKRHLDNQKITNVKILFVSLDPTRDKPQGIRKYLDLFDPSFIGLTATNQNDSNFIDMKAKFKVYSNKIKGEGEAYNIDHTSLVFIMSPKSEFMGILNTSLPEKEAAAQLIKTKLSKV